MTQKRLHYSKQFKIDAVKLVTEQGYNVSEAARNLGVHHSSQRRCKKQLESNGRQAFPGKGYLISKKEELKRLRMVRDIIKKAPAFFAKESE
ncbi:MAG: transposase [Bacteroides sp.]|nr:transposase [Bacteroides sp.]